MELFETVTPHRQRAVNRNRPIWLIAADYNQKSREINGNTTTTLRRRKGEKIDLKFKMMGN